MSGGFSNKPKILKGYFLDHDIFSFPPLLVPFQFNPEEITRKRSVQYSSPVNTALASATGEAAPVQSLRELHQRTSSLDRIQKSQQVAVQEEEISFDIRLDASDATDAADPLAVATGVDTQLSALEMMLHPKGERLLAKLLMRRSRGFRFSRPSNPPLILFIWGVNKIMPVNITSMSIKEIHHNVLLYPTRAVVSVSMTAVEGPNMVYSIHKAKTEVSALLNLWNVAKHFADLIVPL